MKQRLPIAERALKTDLTGTKANRKGDAFRALFQFFLILLPFAFFYDTLLIRKGPMNLSVSEAVLLFLLINGSCLILLILTAYSFRKEGHDFSFRPSMRHLPFSALLLLFITLSLFQINNLPKYDGGLYYDALLTGVRQIEFTSSSMLSSMVLWTHPTYGMTLLTFPAELLLPWRSTGVYLMTLFLMLLTLCALYQLLGKLFPELSCIARTFGVAFFALHPYVSGLLSHVNPDHYCLMFFILLVWAVSNNYEYLGGFFCLLLVFSKETGIMFAGPFLLFTIFYQAKLTSKNKGIRAFWGKNMLKQFLIYGISPVLFLLYYRFSGTFAFAQTETGQSPMRWDSDGIHCFGFSLPFVSMKTTQILVFNLFWISTLIFLVVVIVFFWRKYRLGQTKSLLEGLGRFDLLIGIFMSYATFFVFSLLYITHALPRYNVYFVLPGSFFLLFSIHYLSTKKQVRILCMSLLTVLFLVQNYVTIDPSLIANNRSLDLGKSTIYSPTRYLNIPIVYEMYVYNRQYAYTESLVDHFMEHIHFSYKDTIVTLDSGDYELLIIGEKGLTSNPIYWNPNKMERTYSNQDPDSFIPHVINLESKNLIDSEAFSELPGDFYLVLLDRNSDPVYLKAIEAEGYTLSESFEEENMIGKIQIHHFVKQ